MSKAGLFRKCYGHTCLYTDLRNVLMYQTKRWTLNKQAKFDIMLPLHLRAPRAALHLNSSTAADCFSIVSVPRYTDWLKNFCCSQIGAMQMSKNEPKKYPLRNPLCKSTVFPIMLSIWKRTAREKKWGMSRSGGAAWIKFAGNVRTGVGGGTRDWENGDAPLWGWIRAKGMCSRSAPSTGHSLTFNLYLILHFIAL